jgi:hypothetical protein
MSGRIKALHKIFPGFAGHEARPYRRAFVFLVLGYLLADDSMSAHRIV